MLKTVILLNILWNWTRCEQDVAQDVSSCQIGYLSEDNYVLILKVNVWVCLRWHQMYFLSWKWHRFHRMTLLPFKARLEAQFACSIYSHVQPKINKPFVNNAQRYCKVEIFSLCSQFNNWMLTETLMCQSFTLKIAFRWDTGRMKWRQTNRRV